MRSLFSILNHTSEGSGLKDHPDSSSSKTPFLSEEKVVLQRSRNPLTSRQQRQLWQQRRRAYQRRRAMQNNGGFRRNKHPLRYILSSRLYWISIDLLLRFIRRSLQSPYEPVCLAGHPLLDQLPLDLQRLQLPPIPNVYGGLGAVLILGTCVLIWLD
ncbi:MAG: hypothetical protein HC768_03530 [Acaryochloris sp. CRU_2_0]|nr:hypothetical protein [Acaryochloris sp. CRU_2_0]